MAKILFIILGSVVVTAMLFVIVAYAMGTLFSMGIRTAVKGWARFFNVDR